MELMLQLFLGTVLGCAISWQFLDRHGGRLGLVPGLVNVLMDARSEALLQKPQVF